VSLYLACAIAKAASAVQILAGKYLLSHFFSFRQQHGHNLNRAVCAGMLFSVQVKADGATTHTNRGRLQRLADAHRFLGEAAAGRSRAATAAAAAAANIAAAATVSGSG
jgi:hypothetical protein